jgi:hypothetical protein
MKPYDFNNLIETLEAEGLNWDFYEVDATLEEVRENTVSGQVVARVESLGGPRAAGLLTAFAARRSLACWFVYCADLRPLEIADAVIEHWVIFQNTTLPKSWSKPIKPMEGNKPIVDCRYSDTASASSAVAHAAKYAGDRNLLDAITSLSHAVGAFDCSPIGSTYVFEKWLLDYAIPIAMQGRAMTEYEAFADADSEWPIQLRKK